LTGLIMALITYVDGDRVAIVSHDARVTNVQKTEEHGRVKTTFELTDPNAPPPLQRGAEAALARPNEVPFLMRMSHRPWVGPVFLAVLLLVIFITNVPLRGLWSLVVVIVII